MIVDIEKLSVDYAGIKALDSISFGIDEGDFLGIIGPNGAGKSTLFRCMLGLHTQYDGIVTGIKHEYEDLITTHLHSKIEGDKCMELFMMQGNAEKVANITKEFQINKKLDTIKIVAL